GDDGRLDGDDLEGRSRARADVVEDAQGLEGTAVEAEERLVVPRGTTEPLTGVRVVLPRVARGPARTVRLPQQAVRLDLLGRPHGQPRGLPVEDAEPGVTDVHHGLHDVADG